MPRILRYGPGEEAAAALTELVLRKKEPRRRVTTRRRAVAELDGMLAGEKELRASHLVAFWMRCHQMVYGVVPSEMEESRDWSRAVYAASTLVRKEFGGNTAEALEFLKWTWRRERAREERAKERREKRVGRVGWQLQFCHRNLLTDWRLEQARQGRIVRRR